jgi:hemerythrin
MIVWTPSLAVGIDEIDAQHRELFRRAELFLSGLETCSRQEIGILLSYLRFYAVTHFGAEEAWMREQGYPEYAGHKKQHDGFVKDLVALSKENERRGGEGLQPMRVGSWLESWLTEHVSRSDSALATWLLGRTG